MTSDLEEGEIEDVESGSTSTAIWTDRPLQFVYTGDDGERTEIRRERRGSSPYSPTSRLSLIELEPSSHDRADTEMDARPANRMVGGGYWAPLSSVGVKKEAASASATLSEENADVALPRSSSDADTLLKKYRDIRQELEGEVALQYIFPLFACDIKCAICSSRMSGKSGSDASRSTKKRRA